mgnify:CR=1 FL=1
MALSELIARVNDLFEGDLTPGDKLVYVNDVIRGKQFDAPPNRPNDREIVIGWRASYGDARFFDAATRNDVGGEGAGG